eukprot:UN02079
MEISYSKNGEWLDVAHRIPHSFRGSNFFPIVSLQYGELEANFGATLFEHLTWLWFSRT